MCIVRSKKGGNVLFVGGSAVVEGGDMVGGVELVLWLRVAVEEEGGGSDALHGALQLHATLLDRVLLCHVSLPPALPLGVDSRGRERGWCMRRESLHWRRRERCVWRRGRLNGGVCGRKWMRRRRMR